MISRHLRHSANVLTFALLIAVVCAADGLAWQPTDNFKPMDLVQLCTPDEETPRGAPLHPGAERFYRERGYLRT